ncbi:MAG: HDOD domain-containing protein [Desulfobulbaceae bacterium]|jgi:HD-like signal output (HDOD) protein|nr:HDOD domain-containing protein [Desulfobulbaceae bacterium]
MPVNMIDVGALPALPQVLIDLIDACGRQDVTVSDVGPIISRDPALTARVLQLANSALFGARHPIGDIGQAVVFLGLDILRNLAISASVHEVFRVGKGDNRWMAVFWHRAILSASFCQKLAVKLACDKPSDAYLAGLLDGIGMLFFYVRMPERYAAMLTDTPRKDWETALCAAEATAFGYTRREIGGMLLRTWKLAELAELVAAPSLERLPSVADLLSVLTIARLRLTGQTADSSIFPDQRWLKAAEIEDLYAAAEDSVDELARMMGLRIESPLVELPVVAPEEDGKRRLTDRMLSMARLEGLLASLLAASDLAGICQVLEQGMAVLLGVEYVLPLIPDHDRLQFYPSRRNPLHDALSGRLWPENDRDSCVALCRGAGFTCHISQEAGGQAEREILVRFGTTALLAAPVPLDTRRRGVALLGLNEGQLPAVQKYQETILLFTSHVGARIHQEEMRRRQARLLARRELQVAENIARGILHEIVNPLATVRNAIRVMEDKLVSGNGLAAILALIGGESERIGQVAGQLRCLAESVQEARLQEIDLNDLLAEIVTLFRGLAPERRFDEHYDAALEPFSSSPDILRQTLEILLDTAGKAVADGGVVTVATSDSGDGLATVDIRISERRDPAWRGDILVAQLARKRLFAVGGRVISRADGESGWLFRLTAPTTPSALEGDENFLFDY